MDNLALPRSCFNGAELSNLFLKHKCCFFLFGPLCIYLSVYSYNLKCFNVRRSLHVCVQCLGLLVNSLLICKLKTRFVINVRMLLEKMYGGKGRGEHLYVFMTPKKKMVQ